MVPEYQPEPTLAERIRAYSVHLLTASGIVFVFLAATELFEERPHAGMVFWWLALAGIVDAIDGPLARRWQVNRLATRLDGRTLDDIIDFLSFSFIPLLLVWRMQWAGEFSALLAVLALFVSLLGFANIYAKQDKAGFFTGFPSYWNLAVYYCGIFHAMFGPQSVIILILLLTVLTVVPMRFIYPNRTAEPWKTPVIVGGGVWLLLLLATLPFYPDIPPWVVWLSLSYPAFYVGLSIYLDLRSRLFSGG